VLILAFWMFAATVAFGAVLFTLHLRAVRATPWAVAAAHGLLGAASIAVLFFALASGAPRGMKYGVASFGMIAESCAALALIAGLIVLFLKRRAGQRAPLAVAIHATVAVFAFVLLFAYVALGGS
jgi:hypothetical protein